MTAARSGCGWRTRMPSYDAIVVGSGPNGLAAAITFARAGRSVLLIESRDSLGGGTRTAELTLPGFRHDVCAAIHPLAPGSPFLSTLPLERFGVEWVQPDIPVAHPLDDGTAVGLYRSLEQTASSIGMDGRNWVRLFGPLAADWPKLAPVLLGPHPLTVHLGALVRFGLAGVWPARLLSPLLFGEERARALFAGLVAHSLLDFRQPFTSSFGLVLGILGHAVGWPFPRGGSQAIADAMGAYLRALGGDIVAGWPVRSLDELPSSRTVLLDVAPRQVVRLAGTRLPPAYLRRLERFRYGPGVFKVDYALSEPVPWRAEICRDAGTVHLGGTLAEIAASEEAACGGRIPERPYVLVAQHSRFDTTRAPAGKHTLWAYCHTPHGSTVDMAPAIEAQIERFAPGFQDTVQARAALNSADLERYNPNYVGGNISSGANDFRQLWTRPMLRFPPYSTPVRGLYLCSSSTPPGAGVHGMCGYNAARAALTQLQE
ncbi:MAG: NAD(P)/FAD-dependent oxidoreductase [Caldilineaceae bacterium]|nr:NAD(P)/FAD-dependent oxidoreductase [Caldilineaceae bacterium]